MQIKLKSDDINLKIQILHILALPYSQDSNNLFKCSLRVSVPGFSGSLECEILGSDLQRFYAELQTLNKGRSGSARLSGGKPGINITFSMKHSAQVTGRYEFQNPASDVGPTKLTGSFRTTDKQLKLLVEQIHQVLEQKS